MAVYNVYIYVYDQFQSLPDETNLTASATSITTLGNITGYVAQIEDDDGIFSEIDPDGGVRYGNDGTTPTDQVFAQNFTGTYDPGSGPVNFSVPAGVPIHTAYDLINSGTGHQITSLHIYGNGYQQGPVVGIVSTIPLESNTTYTFDVARSSYLQDNPYDQYVQCFTEGTLIATPDGPRVIEDIEVGDLVDTLDGPAKPVRWHGCRTVEAKGNLAPVVFSPGALGNDRELVLSPQHRVLLSGWKAQLLAGEDEVLAAAVHMLGDDRVHRREGGDVTYHHIMFDAHEIVFAEGAPVESFLPGRLAITGIDDDARCELSQIFPELMVGDLPVVEPARRILAGYEARAIAG